MAKTKINRVLAIENLIYDVRISENQLKWGTIAVFASTDITGHQTETARFYVKYRNEKFLLFCRDTGLLATRNTLIPIMYFLGILKERYNLERIDEKG